MAFEQGYTITQDGLWPLEQYRIKMKSPPFSYGAQNDYPYETYFYYVNNPIIRIDEIYKKYVKFVNIEQTEEDISLNIAWLNSTSNIALNTSAIRLNEYFQFSQFFKSNISNPYVLYSFTFFPKKLFLMPINARKINASSYEITLSAILLEEKSNYFSHPVPDSPAYAPQSLYNYLKTPSPLYIQTDNSVNTTLFYNIHSNQEIVKKTIHTFGNTQDTNPISRNFLLESDNNTNFKIRQDSFFFEGVFNYPVFDPFNYGGWYVENISYIYGDNPQASLPYNANFLMYYDPTVSPNTQTFSYVQSSDNRDFFESSISSVLSASLSLNTGVLRYNAKRSPRTNTNLVSGLRNTNLTASYTLDADALKFSRENVIGTVNSFSILGTPSFTKSNIGTGVYFSPNVKNDTITINTKYPPYYYSYNVGVSAKTLPNTTDNSYLTFHLELNAISNTTNAIFSAKAFFKSDYGFLSLDSSEFYNDNDLIMYQPEYTDVSLLNDVPVYYKANGARTLYNLKSPTWVKLKDAHTLEIHNPKTFVGNPILTIRPKLSTVGGFKDGIIVSSLVLTGLLDVQKYPLDLKTVAQGNDYIDVTAESMVDEETFPGIDLRNSKISWKVDPVTPTTKVLYLKESSGNYTPINTLNTNTALDFNSNTWAIRVSGYGGITTRITLSSQKRDDTTYIDTDLFYYDAFIDKKLLIEPKVNLDNLPEIRTITLKCIVPYKGRYYNLPKTNTIYWDWSYDGDTNTNLITAFYENGTVYKNHDANFTTNLSSLVFHIKPLSKNTATQHNVKINCYTVDTPELLTDSYEFQVDDYPSSSLVKMNIQVAHNSFPNDIILDTSKNENVLTRSFSQNTNFLLKSILPTNVDYTGNEWKIIEPNGNIVTSSSLNFNYNATQLGTYKIYLRLLNFKYPTWTNLHILEKSITFYKLEDSYFNKEIKIQNFAEYAWKNSDQLTILDEYNYSTTAAATTAYSYKKTRTENYYVSTNIDFDRYVYTYGSNNKLLLDTTNDGINKLTLEYTDELLSPVGAKLYLSAFNSFYPTNTPLYYKTIESGSLVTKKYNIVGETIPYSLSTPNGSRFLQNPKLIDYNGINHAFNTTLNIFDLDFNRNIVVRQTFTPNPLNTPAKIITGESTVTYLLSTSKWLAKKEVPAIDGTYTLFTIRPGDDVSPLRVSDVSRTTLYLNATANLNIKIPESTFNTVNQGNLGLKIGGDLWESKNIKIPTNINWQTLQAYTTSTLPEIFFNTIYALTGTQLFVEFKTPEYTTNPIVSYAVNFGEGDIQIKDKDEKFYINYSNIGSYYVSYSAIYQNSNKKTYIAKVPFIIKNKWDQYDKEKIRIINESTLDLPFSLNDVLIQPNEFGDADIFNTSLNRLNENLNYLINNIQTMNSYSPTYYYGWLGSNKDNRSAGIRWYTQTYGSEFYDKPTYAINEGKTYFNNIKDVLIKNYIYVLDDKKFRLFSKDKNCKEIIFTNSSEADDLFFDPRSIAVNSDETSIFIADSIRHKIYRFDFDFSDELNPLASLVLSTGTLGSLNDTNNFDYPSEIFSHEDYIYVLDYNNNCIKQFSNSLSWVHTYYDDILSNDQILNFTVHETGLLYVVTKNYKLHIFDEYAENVYTSFELDKLGSSQIVKICFDEAGEFLYIITESNVFKYSSSVEFITTFNLPDITGIKFTGASSSSNREINISTNNSILKFQDLVELFKIGDGLDLKYWTPDQILLKKEEFATDLNYNLSLNRFAQNLKTFRNSLNSRFVLVTEQTARGTATYFSLIPISKEDISIFEDDVENENLKIGINEFHVPPVINRELTKLYNSLLILKQKLDIKSVESDVSNLDNTTDSKCNGDFCWSWKAMSCYDLSLPLIRLCNINPITYSELMSTFPVNYAPTKQWKDATSNCCNEYVSPLI
jgi:hypothetical protein